MNRHGEGFQPGWTARQVAQAAQIACLLEVSAPKPGNVSRYADFADTRFEDFLLSAVATTGMYRLHSKGALWPTILVGYFGSIGVATLPDVAASADGLMRAADRAMYRVKEHGKNGISVFTV